MVSQPDRAFCTAAGGASARANYSLSELRKQASTPLALKEVARISVLHSSVLDYLVKLVNERYQVLASFPDFTSAVSITWGRVTHGHAATPMHGFGSWSGHGHSGRHVECRKGGDGLQLGTV